MILTRPEITFAVNKLSQYISAPILKHFTHVRESSRYLMATQDYGRKFFKEGSMWLTSFTAAN